MSRLKWIIFIPPVAVYGYGRANVTCAPIALFWLTSLISIVYGFLGGVRELTTTSWIEIILGLTLWIIASSWAYLAVKAADIDG